MYNFYRYYLQLLCITFFTFSSHAITYRGPLVVDDAYIAACGNVITGDFQTTSSQSALTITTSFSVTVSQCNILGSLTGAGITVTTSAPVTITNCTIQGPSNLISGNLCDLTVLNTNGYGTNPNVLNQKKGFFITVTHVHNLYVQNCGIDGVFTGIYVNQYSGNFTDQQTITILNNQISNIDGRLSDGNGGYLTTNQSAPHAFQLNHVYSVPFIEIAWNQIINQPYNSFVSDVINIINSSGKSTNHMLIHDNFIQGAYPPAPGSSFSGGGIIIDGQAGDTPPTTSAFVDIFNNQIVSTANYGISIAAGNNNSMYNNRVVTSGYLSDGTLITTTYANGIENYNFHSQPSNVFFNNNAYSNNPVGLIRPNGTGRVIREDFYLTGQVGLQNNVHWQPNNSTNPTVSDENNEYQLWLNKLAANNETVGNPNFN